MTDEFVVPSYDYCYDNDGKHIVICSACKKPSKTGWCEYV